MPVEVKISPRLHEFLEESEKNTTYFSVFFRTVPFFHHQPREWKGKETEKRREEKNKEQRCRGRKELER